MIRVGTASWTDESLIEAGWYPSAVKGKSSERLLYYAERFDTVELDATYYALIARKVFENWTAILPENFTMHVKAYAPLTKHDTEAVALPKDLKEKFGLKMGRIKEKNLPEELKEIFWERWLDSLEPIANSGHEGYLLFQFSSSFQPNKENLAYLEEVRARTDGHLLALEFRHSSWYQPHVWPEVRDLLKANEIVHVCVDEPDVQGAAPRVLEATHPKVSVLRVHGRNKETWYAKNEKAYHRFNYVYLPEEIGDLYGAMQALEAQVPLVYGIFNVNYGTQGVDAARAIQERSGTLPPLEQPELF